MKNAFILFPNNLFKNTAPLKGSDAVFLVEEFLFFGQYAFHKQKLIFHRASMKAYADYLRKKNFSVHYTAATESLADIRLFIPELARQEFNTVTLYDPCDEWLEKRIKRYCTKKGLKLVILDNPLFINTRAELTAYQDQRKKYFQTDFYTHQRKYRKVLVNEQLEPLNGKWSFDADNRLKYPAGKKPPAFRTQYSSSYHKEAADYVQRHYAVNYGEASATFYYPINHEQAEKCLQDFFEYRFAGFGLYEDAILEQEVHLHHSVISPLLNTGLLLPMEVIEKATAYAFEHDIPFNSLEGFVRQVLGWREFIRMVYIREGNKQRTKNFWQFSRKIPSSFYTGATGIRPVDDTIKKLLRSGYNHHIERLMILGNFMLLCEFDPNEVYQWFMEMYIDAYDWVMVPNIYGMTQFSDGGLMCTKPYISGSNYILKMSDYKKGEPWAETWDALFWRFMHVHRSFFLQNPRLGMLVKTFDKWDAAKRAGMIQTADAFLQRLDKQ